MYYRPLTPSHSFESLQLFHGIRATHSVVTVAAGGLVQEIPVILHGLLCS